MQPRRHFPRSAVAMLREKILKEILPAIRSLNERVGEIEALLEQMESTPRKDEVAA